MNTLIEQKFLPTMDFLSTLSLTICPICVTRKCADCVFFYEAVKERRITAARWIDCTLPVDRDTPCPVILLRMPFKV